MGHAVGVKPGMIVAPVLFDEVVGRADGVREVAAPQRTVGYVTDAELAA